MKKQVKFAVISLAMTGTAVLARAEGSIITDLQGQATTAITAAVVAVTAVMVAGFAIPVITWSAKKIRGAFSRS